MKHDEQLKDYLARNYRLTPLKARSKSPIYKEWQSRPTNLAEFPPNLNIGIILGTASGGLVDIDLDRRAAIIAARYPLRPTEARFGRQSTSVTSSALVAVAGSPFRSNSTRSPSG